MGKIKDNNICTIIIKDQNHIYKRILSETRIIIKNASIIAVFLLIKLVYLRRRVPFSKTIPIINFLTHDDDERHG